MDKKAQSVYLESLKEYRDWYSLLSTAENDGIVEGLKLAEEKIQKAQQEKEKAQQEKQKAQQEKEKLLEEKKESVINLFNIGLSKEKIANAMKLSLKEIEDIIKGK